MVTRLDRLARSTRDLLNTLAAVAVREAGFRSLGDTWADTTSMCQYEAGLSIMLEAAQCRPTSSLPALRCQMQIARLPPCSR
jgi:DNA invertase Pin-like site-specific DNA recombinase